MGGVGLSRTNLPGKGSQPVEEFLRMMAKSCERRHLHGVGLGPETAVGGTKVRYSRWCRNTSPGKDNEMIRLGNQFRDFMN